MSTQTITAVEFLMRSRERKESWRTMFLVAGIKVAVIAYDLFKKGFHEVYVVTGEALEERNVLHIPQMYIQRDSDRVSRVLSSVALAVS